MRSEIRRAIDSGFAAAWGSAFWVIGSLRRKVERWSSPGSQRVLVIAPHPDDEVAGCGGVILLHAQAGDQVTVMHVTDGRASRVASDPREVARLRRAEAESSLQVLGVHRWEWLGLPEGEWSDDELAKPLDQVVTELAPQVIYAPSSVDFHPEHRRVAAVTGTILDASDNRERIVRSYQVQVPLTRTLVNLIAPIGPVLPQVQRARESYRTQEGSLRAPTRLRYYAARAHHLPGVAEEFWEMTGRAYATTRATDSVGQSAFRGLRRLAVSDPLAFLVGRAQRRRILALASIQS
jgi:LmbE family N-acetylglucosaminyl deacetylase